MRLTHLLSAALLAVSLTGAAQASLMVYEGFNYTPNDTNPANWNGGTGFSSTWSIGLEAGVTASGTIVNGLAFSDYAESGYAVYVTGSHASLNNKFQLYRPLSATVSGTAWMSYLFKYDAANSPPAASRGNGGIRISSDTAFTNQGKLAILTNSASGANAPVAVGVNGAYGGSTTTDVQLNGSTYLMIAKFVPSGGNTVGTMWTLNETGYYNVEQAGFTEASLTTNATQTATITNTSPSPDLVDPGNYWVYMTRVGTGGLKTSLWLDEFKIGQTMADVIPEPATLTLLALGGLAALLRRRSR